MAEDDDTARHLRAQCEAVGFDLDRAKGTLVERVGLLAEHTEIFEDAKRLASYAERIFRYHDEVRPVDAFSALERQTTVLACLFSDIGKTGPEDADPEARRLITEAFAVENVGDDRQTVASFFQTHFATDAGERIRRFCALGLDPTMTMREFWNLHSGWTLAIVEAAGLPREAVAAAATHHLLDEVNPEAIVGADDRFTRHFGSNVRFDRAEKLVILLDKYDAVRRRGHRTHDEAIAWLADRIAKSARFHDDVEFRRLLADVDAVLGVPVAEP